MRFTLEFYLEIAISSCIRVRAVNFATVPDFLLTTYAMSLGLLLIVVTVGSAIFLRVNFNLLDSEEFKNSYGSLYLGVRTNNKHPLLQTFAFMLRRLIYALIIVFFQERAYLQIMTICFM